MTRSLTLPRVLQLKYLIRRSQAGNLPDEIRLRPKTRITRDLMLLHATSGRWDPSDTEPETGRLPEVIDWGLLPSYLRETPMIRCMCIYVQSPSFGG